MADDPGMSTAVAAIQTLLEFMNQNSGKIYLHITMLIAKIRLYAQTALYKDTITIHARGQAFLVLI